MFVFFLLAPIYLLIAIEPSAFITNIVDDKWEDLVEILPLISVMYLYNAIGSDGGSIMLAHKLYKVNFVWKLFWTTGGLSVIYISAIMLGDLQSVVASYCAFTLIFGLLWHYILYAYCRVNLFSILSQLKNVIIAMCILLMAFALTDIVLINLMHYIVFIAIWFGLYFLLVMSLDKALFNDIKSIVTPLLSRNKL